MKDLLKISVLDNDDQIEAIFGKSLPTYEKRNLFPYVPSVGFYDKNMVRFQVGFVFNTPSGRESKLYPYLNIKIKEDEISGKCEWVSDETTPSKILEKIKHYTRKDVLDFYFKGDKLKPKYNLGIKYLVVSKGSGGCECYKLSMDDL